MKKLLAILLSIALILSLAACGESENTENSLAVPSAIEEAKEDANASVEAYEDEQSAEDDILNDDN